MNIDGFELLLQDYCSYCQNFEPEVEKIDVTSFGEATRYVNNIRCESRHKCARIAENLENRIDGKRGSRNRDMNDYMQAIIKALRVIHDENVMILAVMTNAEMDCESAKKMDEIFEEAIEGVLKK